ncbi:MAG: helix-turn-helix transcriptional regulator [Chloroflexi bacterium]|nr:helix-turn-helix transcriptional regulator [Chloroflexota bacterium]
MGESRLLSRRRPPRPARTAGRERQAAPPCQSSLAGRSGTTVYERSGNRSAGRAPRGSGPHFPAVIDRLRQDPTAVLHAFFKVGRPRCAKTSQAHGEKEVAVLVYLELTNPEIACRLVLSPNTVKTHIRHILAKFGLISREELRRELAGLDFSDFLNNRFASGVPPRRFRLTPWGY